MTSTIHAGAALLNIDRRTLKKRMASLGHNVDDTHAKYPIAELAKAAYSTGDLKAEKTRETAARADLLELEREREMKRSMSYDKAIELLNSWGIPIRQKLVALPSEMASRCNPTDPELARAQLETWSVAAMRAIQGEIAALCDREEDNEPTEERPDVPA
jgi:hypothetical protein